MALHMEQIYQDFDGDPSAVEWTPTGAEFADGIEYKKWKNEGGASSNLEQHPITEEEAKDEANEAMKDKASLELLKNMEQLLYIHEHSSDPNMSRVIKEYKDLKKRMGDELSVEAKQALEQAWIHLDTNNDNRSIDETRLDTDNANSGDRTTEFEPPKDDIASSEILKNPETRQQRKLVQEVVDNRSSLSPDQQRLLDEALNAFKTDIETVYTQFKSLNNNEELKRAA